MRRILLVEDEPSLVVALSDRLAAEGYRVDAVEDGEEAVERALGAAYDLVLLDVMLPGKSGFDVCRELRAAGSDVPILMLTARGEVVDRVVGLKLGADDYLVKPFAKAELLARIEALLRRGRPTAGGKPSRFRFGEVEADFRRAEVHRGGELVHLSALELRLLRYFVEYRGEVLDRQRLLDEVWGYESTAYSRTVDQHVSSLRRKIEPQPSHPRHIVTVHGMGYRFDP